MKFGDVMSKFR